MCRLFWNICTACLMVWENQYKNFNIMTSFLSIEILCVETFERIYLYVCVGDNGQAFKFNICKVRTLSKDPLVTITITNMHVIDANMERAPTGSTRTRVQPYKLIT